MAISRKFSAKNFWKEVKKYNASRFIYIGELCRYLNNRPVTEDEADNPLKCILGNGMRAEYWQAFQKRFAVEKIIEVYGATEGVGGLINQKGVPGMVGRLAVSGILKMGEVAQCDRDTGRLKRNSQGFAIKCIAGETGIFLPKLGKLNQFSGYKNKNLAVYARPRILRLREKADTTSTFKQLKTKLKEAGFNPEKNNDPLFFLDPVLKEYTRLTPDLYEKIQSGQIQF